MEGLQTGRIVHYMPFDHESPWAGNSSHRAAIITNLFGTDGMANLTVFMDFVNDGEQYRNYPLLWATSRKYSESLEKGTWHWPEKA